MNILLSNPMLRAYEGAQFVCANATPGTTIATGSSVAQTFGDTKPTYVIKNNAPTASGIIVMLHSLSLLQIGGTAPATTTSVQAAVTVDSGDRTPSGGTSLMIPVNTTINGKTSQTQVWVPNAANPTVPGAVASRVVGRRQLKGGPSVLLDEYELIFGTDGPSLKMANGAVGTFSTRLPAVQLQPQQFALIYLWFPGGATNPFTHEFELQLSER